MLSSTYLYNYYIHSDEISVNHSLFSLDFNNNYII
jgi:hypothetical protein